MDAATPFYYNETDAGLHVISPQQLFRPFYQQIDQYAKLSAHKVAVKFNGDEWTYQMIADCSNRLARLLAGRGVKKGSIVGLAVDRSPQMIVSLLGILKAGASYLPLDPAYPKERIEFMLADSSADLLITQKKYQHSFIHNGHELLMEDVGERLDIPQPEIINTSPQGDDTAYVLYTSGSTGQPKGIMISHYNLANFLTSMARTPGITASDRLLAISTISFDIAAFELFLPLTVGAQIILADTDTAKDGWLLLQLMQKERISIMQATPYTWRMLIAAGWKEPLPVRIITGGEALPKDLAAKLLKRCAQVWNQYGPTETTVYSTQKHIQNADDITIGKPVGQTQVYILDECCRRCPDGTEGEICIGGAGVAKGYLHRPDLTNERFINDPYTGDGNTKMYRTGDLGRILPNGEIQYLGRIDHQVKIRGFRIELEEVEFAIQKALGVAQAVVAAASDLQGNAKLVAYIVLKHGAPHQSDNTLMKAAIGTLLPSYMVPDDFIIMDEMPVTPNGKVDRKALLTSPNISQTNQNAVTVPTSKSEEQLKCIWEDALNCQNISTDDNFFSIGGHSLAAVKIMTQLAKVTGKRLPIATLFKYPTIAQLAHSLDNEDITVSFSSLVPIKPNGSKPPLYIIHGEGLNVMYFNDLAARLDQEQPVFGLQARGLNGDEPLEVMEDIAANYINEILLQNPNGPYLLAGYSFGGYVAVEMRKQLTAMGKEVRLIIFDTDAEKSHYKSWVYLWPRKLKRHLPHLVGMIKDKLLDSVKDITPEPKRSPELQNRQSQKEFYGQMNKIKQKLRTALRNYTIEPFDDKVYLYKAKTCTHYVNDVDSLGWKQYAKKGVETFEVSGDHLSMLLCPQVESFAVSLQQGIDSWGLKGR